ncbi:nuclear transport factor 2 family protein [Paenibacillus peoriae]|uniref:nuclear transport factor 2 family protein n=1 Tax=Paenibacillus peoriae TaxID=59893 RepID=UPI00026C5F0C|nr:nuclear transport factor 2 family protein [Paenibacillus peoriae]MEC0180807.1 nuclear transport factor 2 family protein [Paenibacillus peoriae]
MSRVTLKDYEAIVNAMNGYIEGNIVGKGEVMKSTFHKDAIMYGYTNDGKLSEGSIQNLYDLIDTLGPAKDLQYRIDVLDVAVTVAVVRVILESPEVEYADYHTLLKVDGEWKVISKVFHQY